MKSKTSFFSRTLFLSQLKRFWPIFVAYLATMLVALPIALNTQLGNLEQQGNSVAEMASCGAYTVLSSGLCAGVIIIGIFSIMFAMAAFSYLYSERSASMICSLPYKRTGVFVSLFTPALCGMLLSNVLAALAGLAVGAAFGVSLAGVIFQWLAMTCLMVLFFYGFAALCASFTGHILVLPAVYIVLNFTAYVVEFVVRTILETFVYGLSMSGGHSITFLSPALNMMYDHSVDYTYADPGNYASEIVGAEYNGWTALIIYGIVGVLFALCAMLLIKNRRMEAAKDVIAIKPLKPVFKYCMTFGCALVIGLFIYYMTMGAFASDSGMTTMLTMLGFMLLGAFIGYFGSEMLINKSLKVFKGKVWIGFAVSVVIIVGLMFACEYDAFGYERYVPESDQVQEVYISCDGESAVLTDSENIAETIEIQRSIIANKALNENAVVERNTYESSVHIMYTLKDDSTVSRNYNIHSPATDDAKAVEALLNTTEAIVSRNKIDFEMTESSVSYADVYYNDGASQDYALSDAEAAELYNTCIVPDMQEGKIGTVIVNYYDQAYLNTRYDCNISFTVLDPSVKSANSNNERPTLISSDNKGRYEQYLYFTPTVDSTRTIEWLRAHGIDPLLCSETQALYDTQDGYTVQTEAVEVPADAASNSTFGYDPTDPDDNPDAKPEN